MEVSYKRQFLKDLSKIPSVYRGRIEDLVFKLIPKESAQDVLQRISKLKGKDHFFKIRVGEYRIGMYFENNAIEFKRVLHRKEIYRYFP
jgi:mRNA interferase RelE/StbE